MYICTNKEPQSASRAYCYSIPFEMRILDLAKTVLYISSFSKPIHAGFDSSAQNNVAVYWGKY